MSERDQFEAWFSEDGKYPHAVKRSGEGYRLAAANSQWEAWQASREAIKDEQPASERFMCVPAADLYELMHKGGEAYSYTSSASDAAYWVKEGYTVREYVKLERLQEAFDQPVTDSWIACADRMPELGKEVLVYRPDAPESGDPQIRLAIRNDRRPHGFSCYCIPTHWMPLPAPPSNHPIDTTSQQYEALSKGESK